MGQIGVADLETGTYTQMRLYLGPDPDNDLNLLGTLPCLLQIFWRPCFSREPASTGA